MCSAQGRTSTWTGGHLGQARHRAPAGPGGTLSLTHRGWGYRELPGGDGVPKPNVNQARAQGQQDLREESKPGLMPGSNQRKQRIKVRASSGIRVTDKSKCTQGRRPRAQGQPRAARQPGLFPEGGGQSFLRRTSRGRGLQQASLVDI